MMEGHKRPVRVRFAPSPTGPLHLGTARAGLFNWIFARQNDGVFVLRIEDTDRERSEKKYENEILETFRWLGLNWDEGPYRQSERSEIYEKYIRQLLEKGLAYYCFCSQKQMAEEREAMLAQGFPPKYSGRCRQLKPEEVEKRAKSESSVLRFRVKEGDISFTDTIRGKITTDMELIGDIVIAKDVKTPLYNLAVVIDDHEMKISHVIRGEDHIANTPKQILLQEALGFSHPHYAHLPLILSPDRSKLSKRYLETSIEDYRNEGYLPEAIVNFLVLLGWHPSPEKSKDLTTQVEREIFTKDELLKVFDLKRVQKGGAAFSIEKLEWMNNQYIKSLPEKELLSHLEQFIPSNWDKKKLVKILGIERPRMKKLSDFRTLAEFFFELPKYEAELLIWKEAPKNEIKSNLEKVKEIVDKNEYTTELMAFAEQQGKGNVLWPLRVALSGKTASPDPFEIMTILDKKEIMDRITIAIEKL